MDVKLCNRVLQFKMPDSKAGIRTCPKPPKFCPDLFLTNHRKVVLKCFDMINIDI